MRNSLVSYSHIVVLTTLMLIGTASAHNNMDGQPMNNSGDTANINSGSVPLNGYHCGPTYIVNPLEMTNTRDNRGNITPNQCSRNYSSADANRSWGSRNESEYSYGVTR